MKLRPPKTADVFTVIGMFKKIGNTKLTSMFVSDTTATKKEKPDNDQSIQMGIMVLTELYDNVIGDLQNWFASLIEKTLEEYMEMPPETTLDIIDELVDKLANALEKWAPQLIPENEKFQNKIELLTEKLSGKKLPSVNDDAG